MLSRVHLGEKHIISILLILASFIMVIMKYVLKLQRALKNTKYELKSEIIKSPS